MHHDLYNTLVQSEFWQDEDLGPDLSAITTRLKGGRLAILPKLPSLHDVVADSALSDKILAQILILTSDDNRAHWRQPRAGELHEIRESDLASIVKSHQQLAVLSVDAGHFELPSGAHTSHFVRLAECLANTDDLDRIVYWIARDIAVRREGSRGRQEILLLVDNPSTLIIALRLAQVFPDAKVRYDCVRAYPETPNGVFELSQWLQQRVSGCTEIHCIVSVSSTGRLTAALERAANELNISMHSSVLYGTTLGLRDAPYCNLDITGYWHNENAASCQACNKQQAVFRIDKARYFLTQRNVSSVALPPRLFETQRPFLERYGQYDGVLRTHVNDLSCGNGKHRAFSIDVGRLLAIKEFQDEVEKCIRELTPIPDLVVVPSHEGAQAVGKFIQEKLGLPVFVHATMRLDPANPEDCKLVEKLTGAHSLLIVDDIAYSGERMQSYVKAIRQSGQTYQAPPLITLISLLATPSNDSQFSTAIRGIESDHDGRVLKVRSLYQFSLPDWSDGSCPWCFESRRIRTQAGAFGEDESDETDARGALLGNLETGLVTQDWMSLPAGQHAPVFGKDSPLLDAGASSIQVLFSCASAVQQARTITGVGRLDPEGFPQSKVIGARVIRDFQNETLLVICILRCLLSSELDEEAKNYVRDGLIAKTGEVNDSPDQWALQELLLAQMRGLASRSIDEAKRADVYRKAGFGAFLAA
uniref:phosphoribosyltransferase n=1 Tax=Burkholderia cepacia TaxID=292 RepID=UPI001E5623CF|nr:phosphoribosyltransferase [Burkholderia cepacia]